MITVAPEKAAKTTPFTKNTTNPFDASAVIETDVPTGMPEIVVTVTEPERDTVLPDTEPVSERTMK